MESSNESYLDVSWWFHCNITFAGDSSQWNSHDTFTFTVESPNTWYELGNSIVTSPGDSSHSKDHGNFTVKSSNDTHLRITIKQLKLSNIGFILNMIPLTIGSVTSTEFVWYDSCTHYYIHHGSISFASPLTFNFCIGEHFVFVP